MLGDPIDSESGYVYDPANDSQRIEIGATDLPGLTVQNGLKPSMWGAFSMSNDDLSTLAGIDFEHDSWHAAFVKWPEFGFADAYTSLGDRVRVWGDFSNFSTLSAFDRGVMEYKADFDTGTKPNFKSLFTDDFLNEFQKVSPNEYKYFDAYASSLDVSNWPINPYDRRVAFENAYNGFQVYAVAQMEQQTHEFFAGTGLGNDANDWRWESAANLLGETAGKAMEGWNTIDDVQHIQMAPQVAWAAMQLAYMKGGAQLPVINDANFKYLAPSFITGPHH